MFCSLRPQIALYREETKVAVRETFYSFGILAHSYRKSVIFLYFFFLIRWDWLNFLNFLGESEGFSSFGFVLELRWILFLVLCCWRSWGVTHAFIRCFLDEARACLFWLFLVHKFGWNQISYCFEVTLLDTKMARIFLFVFHMVQSFWVLFWYCSFPFNLVQLLVYSPL